jgi:single-stranded-DNA-specific exonuclease
MLHPVLRRVYAARGIGDAHDLELSLDRLLPVRSLGGVEAACDLLLDQHRRDRRVLVVGDFDADGATSTAVMIRQMRRLGFAHADFLVPDRFRYGYGLTPGIVKVAAERKPDLIVTVDNGIASFEGVRDARQLGIEVLVTDHHLPGQALPEASCIVNPNAPGESFVSKSLAGVGVAFYVMAALTRRMIELGMIRDQKSVSPAHLLDLVALGTVADVVPLDFNNRILVSQGLRRIRAGQCVAGLQALLTAGGRAVPSVVAQDLGFQAGPRLNAAGRLDDMTRGIECLLSDDPREAQSMAQALSRLNADRRELEAKMQVEAFDQLETRLAAIDQAQLPAGICVFDSGWHQGVVGLVASRVKERLHRPVIAFAPTDETGWLKGSARSVPGVHVRDVLEGVATRNPGLLERFGGHAMAAGLSLREVDLQDFELAFADEVARRVDGDTLAGHLHSDGELLPGEFTLETASALRAGGPWGSAFPEPVFDGHFSVLESRVVAERHLKVNLRADSGEVVGAMAFRHLDDPAAPAVRVGDRIELVYRTAVDEFRGPPRLQLIAEWLAPVSRQ